MFKVHNLYSTSGKYAQWVTCSICYSLILNWIKFIFTSKFYTHDSVMTKRLEFAWNACNFCFLNKKKHQKYNMYISIQILWYDTQSYHPVSTDHLWDVSPRHRSGQGYRKISEASKVALSTVVSIIRKWKKFETNRALFTYRLLVCN